MNDADLEIIISLANGDLDGQDRIDALAHVNADPSLASELDTQISMINAVQSLPGAEMTEAERTTLHANLIEQLHLEQAPMVPVPVKRRVAWWQPAVGLASVAAVVFAIVVVPNMLSSTDGDDVAFLEVSTEISAEFGASGGATEPTTTAAGADTTVANDAGGDDATTEEAPSADAGQDGFQDFDLPLYRVPADRQKEFNDLATGETSPVDLREKLERSGFLQGAAVDSGLLQACLEVLEGLPEGVPLAIGDGDLDTVFVGVDAGSGIQTILEIDLATCSVVSEAP